MVKSGELSQYKCGTNSKSFIVKHLDKVEASILFFSHLDNKTLQTRHKNAPKKGKIIYLI